MLAAALDEKHIVRGVVQSGKQLGRTIGFPTANLHIQNIDVVEKGVYGGYIYSRGKRYIGVINVGNRPTFQDGEHITIEAHMMNFNEMIYGEQIEIEFLFLIRSEKKFNSIDALIEQLKLDVKYATNRLKQFE